MAWLYAVPKDAKKSRIDALIYDGMEPDLPDIDAAHIVEYLKDIGFSEQPLSSQELLAWCNLRECELQLWESEFMRKLSREYASKYFAAQEKTCPAPYVPEEISAHNAQAATDKMRRQMKALIPAEIK